MKMLLLIAQFTVTVTRSFIDYVLCRPVVFEVFAHYTHHPLHVHATTDHHSPAAAANT